jgi:hypothetical protein
LQESDEWPKNVIWNFVFENYWRHLDPFFSKFCFWFTNPSSCAFINPHAPLRQYAVFFFIPNVMTNNIMKEIQGIKFGVISMEDMGSISKVEVDVVQLYDEDGKVTTGGLLDLRLGPSKNGDICHTCHGDRDACPGHFGHIDLEYPVIHRFYLKTLVSILRCVCSHCGKLLHHEVFFLIFLYTN